MTVSEAKLAFIFYSQFVKITESLREVEQNTITMFKFKSEYPSPTYFSPDEELTKSLKICVDEKMIEEGSKEEGEVSTHDFTKSDEIMQLEEMQNSRPSI